MAVSRRVGEHGRHDHGPVEATAGEMVPLRDLRGYGPLEESVVDDVLDDPATPGGLLVERGGESAGRPEDDDSANGFRLSARLLHCGDDLRDCALQDVFLLEGVCTERGENHVGAFDGLGYRSWIEGTPLDSVDVIELGKGFWRTKESCDVEPRGETALGEEFSCGTTGSEEGDFHCWLLSVRD